MRLQLTRPLVFFDLETTGVNVASDRIVEISLIKQFPNGNTESKTWRVNPEMHIPKEASDVHHIMDEDVADNMVTDSKAMQFWKADAPMEVTLAGIVMAVSSSQSLKALLPMVVSVLGSVSDENFAAKKA